MEERWIYFHRFGSGRLDVKKGKLVLAYQHYKARQEMTTVIFIKMKGLKSSVNSLKPALDNGTGGLYS
jgi:hypothetical protein